MKKKIIIPITLCVLIIIIINTIFIFLAPDKKEENEYNDKLDKIITETRWSRDGGGDTEHISFGKNGNYSYYCDCGSPVGSSDMYDRYVYNAETKTIKLISDYDKSIYNFIKIKEVSELKLVLDFNGNEKIFYSEEGIFLEANPLPIAGIKYKSNSDIRIEFKKDGGFESYDNKNGGFTYYSDICFTWTYDEKSKMINLECNDEKNRKIKLHSYNPDNLDDQITIYMLDEDLIGIFYPIK